MLAQCKNNVIKQIENIQSLPKNSLSKSAILILDTITAPLLSDLFSTDQLLKIGIKNLYRADRRKKPEPSSIGIYFITADSIKHLYNDFSDSPSKQYEKDDEDSEKSQIDNARESLFYSINILLLEQASDDVLKSISQHEEIIEKLASFGELYLPCRYFRPNAGLIPFSDTASKCYQQKRRASKMTIPPTTQEQGQKKQTQQMRKREHSAHSIHKNNLCCLSDIYFYEFNKTVSPKQQLRAHDIEDNLLMFGKKLCQTVIGGVNFGLSTAIRIANFQSKFSNKIKEGFMQEFRDFIQNKIYQILQAQMDQNITGEKKSIFKDFNDQPEAKQLYIIIADRELDNLSPLIRSFYYQPLLMDVLQVNSPPDHNIKIMSKKLPPTTIQPTDTVFNMYRNQFIHQVFSKIEDNLRDYIANNKAAKFHKESTQGKQQQQFQVGNKDQTHTKAKEMREVIKELPQYKRTIKNYNINTDVLGAIGKINKERNLNEEAELEHLIVTGHGPDRKPVKDKKILEKLMIFLENPTLNIEDKCRLMVLGVCCLDIQNAERNKLITRLSKVQGHGDIAMGLSKISKKGIKKYPLSTMTRQKVKQCYIDRHQCTLATIIDQLITNGLNAKIKSFKIEEVKIQASAVKKQGSLTKQKQKQVEYVVSMCGGMGYNQLTDIQRVLQYSKQEHLRVNFVTDYVFTPSLYLQELCTLL